MAAAPKMIKKIRRDLAPAIKQIWAQRGSGGEFNINDIIADIEVLLIGLDLNTYRPDIATALAHDEDHAMSNSALPDQLHLFTQAEAAEYLLPLNGGQRVFLAHATLAHLRTKQDNQIKQVTVAQNSAQRFTNFINKVAAYLQTRPRSTVTDAMKQLKLW